MGPVRGPGDEEPDDYEARVLAMRRMGRLDNFGIHRVERLDGNIGYLDLRRVPVPAIAGPAMAAAMELIAGTYALIIDLRRNGGGAPDGVVFWCSYLFDGAADPPQRHLPRRHRRDQAVLGAAVRARAPATSTGRSTC